MVNEILLDLSENLEMLLGFTNSHEMLLSLNRLRVPTVYLSTVQHSHPDILVTSVAFYARRSQDDILRRFIFP